MSSNFKAFCVKFYKAASGWRSCDHLEIVYKENVKEPAPGGGHGGRPYRRCATIYVGAD
jgi:hypothetical protein